MSVKIEITTDNAAFGSDPGYEVARILRELANQIALGSEYRVLMDINGNRVGLYEMEDDS